MFYCGFLFCVTIFTEQARWSTIQSQAKMPKIGKFIDDAMDLIDADNPTLKGILLYQLLTNKKMEHCGN